MERDGANNIITIREEVMHLTSNGDIVNISICQRISKPAIESRKIPTDFQSVVRRNNISLSFFPKMLLSFPPG